MLNMKLEKIKIWIFIIAAFGILIPGLSNAQVRQDRVDFGQVTVDTSKSISLDIKNPNPMPITVSCSFQDGNLGFITDMVPILILPDISQKLVVTFTPKETGSRSDVLLVNYSQSLALEKTMVAEQVVVSGEGIKNSDPTMEGLLLYFNDSVNNGYLVGQGKGKSADKRLNTFGRMLDKADKAFIAGDIDETIAHLRSAYRKINVFVVEGEGGDIDELKEMIEFLLKDLGDK